MNGILPFSTLLQDLQRYSVQAVLSVLGIRNRPLRAALEKRFSTLPGKEGSFLSAPLFEATFGWQQDGETMGELARNGLLHPALVDAMNKAKGDPHFPKDRRPYVHQRKAWEILLDENVARSVIISSGTGSGKTETFMVPVLNDLARQAAKGQRLRGVQAIFLYPLNALINNQRERLRAWMKPFGGKLRFCLYNGMTPERPGRERDYVEVADRKTLRADPPPVLVTNPTMLEFMLVRPQDAPILEKSHGQLKWIVLDEAHTYLGSQAAELALLLRRVMEGFGVRAQDVRFIATSATIGGKDKEPLREFLAGIAGIDRQNVSLIEGRRLIPALPDLSLEDASLQQLAARDGKEFTAALARNRTARFIREAFTKADGHVLKADQLMRMMRKKGLTSSDDEVSALEETLQWLETCCRPNSTGDTEQGPFLPLRMHTFHRVMGGLWACCNSQCSARDAQLRDADWPYGQIYLEQRLQCACGAPVYEVASCGECREVYLLAEEASSSDFTKARVIRQRDLEQEDEFSLLVDAGEEEEQEGEVKPGNDNAFPCLILNRKLKPFKETDDLPDPEILHVAFDGAEVSDGATGQDAPTFEIIIQPFMNTTERCPRCQNTPRKNIPSPFRRMFLGTPFHLGISLPILLSHLPKGERLGELPHDGQRLITFTDSRQGTARIAVHLQQGAELNSARSSIYRRLLLDCEGMSREETDKLNLLHEIVRIKPTVENKKRLQAFQEELLSRLPSASWENMSQKLASETDISKWIFQYYKNQDEAYFNRMGAQGIAELLMLREFFRRPKWLNSLETIGLVVLRWPFLHDLKDSPRIWKRLGLSLEEWKNFLGIVIDHYVRANSFVDTDRRMLNWLGIPAHPRRIVHWDREGYRESARWLQFRGEGRLPRIGSLLVRALNLDLSVDEDRDVFNEIFQHAWNDLTARPRAPLQPNTQGEYALDYSRCELIVPEKVWICPITGRALPVVFSGLLERPLSPYLPPGAPDEIGSCDDPVKMPRPETGQRILDETYLREWLQENEQVKALRSVGFWTDLHDRILLGTRFFSVAEHSAQQPGWLLQNYEQRFKEGRINILSCSTTMELGVDIGGLSAVAMNDAPPHPANYLQRCGRAGRRHESRAIAFTMCRNNAHEQMIFRHPEWPFITPPPVPHVGMDSEPIVQRHVNAHLLGQFLKDTVDDAFHLNARAFFLAPEDEEDGLALSDRFGGWLEEIMDDDDMAASLRRLVCATILQDSPAESLIGTTVQKIGEIAEIWRKEHEGLKEEMRRAEHGSPAQSACEKRLERFEKEYLLKELATRAFLPAYGFPIHLAHFNYLSKEEKNRLKRFASGVERDDNRFWLYNLPSRDLTTAIREYAPGADVVMDGRVYKSAGIELSWKIPQTEDEAREPQDLRFAYRCRRCGHVELRRTWKIEKKCEQCGADKFDIFEYLTPTGFSINFSTPPHNDVSHQTFVPPKEPFVAIDEDWTWLPDAALGKWRSSRKANLFQYSAGLHGHGYAICLACGLAESQTQHDELPKTFKKEHKRLRSSAICRGSFNSWMIKKNLHLGFFQQTDMFQLALRENGRWLNDKTFATSLAVAMRQALAEILGVEVEELGYATTLLRLDGQESRIITLYDSCTGGAGFASQAGAHLHELLQKTQEILQCGRECERACHACLLSHDTRYDHQYLNRHHALDFLDRLDPLGRLELAASASISGQRPSLEFTPLLRAIAEQIIRPDADGIFVQIAGPAEEWDLEEWPLMDRLLRWGFNDKQVRVLLDEAAFRDLSEEQRLQLMRLAAASNVQMMSGQMTGLDNTYHLLTAVHLKSGKSIFWVCEDASPLLANGHWGQTDKDPIYRVTLSDSEWQAPEGTTVEISALTLKERETAHNWKIGRQLDGPIFSGMGSEKSFGTRFLDLLTHDAPFLQQALQTGRVESVAYTDRYVNSPLAAALLVSLLDALKPFLAEDATIHVTLADRLPAPYSEPTQIFHNWPDAHERKNVLEALFRKLDIRATITERPKTRMEHARRLSLKFADGHELIMLLDQGLGFWQVARGRSSRYDFTAPAETQARKLSSTPICVTAPRGQVTYIHAWMG